MKLQSAVDDLLTQNIHIESADKSKSNITPQLFTGEKHLLSLSSYPDCTEGILYSMPLLYQKNNRTTLFVRYVSFDHGNYCFLKKCDQEICTTLVFLYKNQ